MYLRIDKTKGWCIDKKRYIWKGKEICREKKIHKSGKKVILKKKIISKQKKLFEKHFVSTQIFWKVCLKPSFFFHTGDQIFVIIGYRFGCWIKSFNDGWQMCLVSMGVWECAYRGERTYVCVCTCVCITCLYGFMLYYCKCRVYICPRLSKGLTCHETSFLKLNISRDLYYHF